MCAYVVQYSTVQYRAGIASRPMNFSWGAATEDEVAFRAHGVFQLPMGIEIERKVVSERVYGRGRGQ